MLWILSQHMQFSHPEWLPSKAASVGVEEVEKGVFVKGRAARTGHQLLDLSVMGGSVQLAHLRCSYFPSSPSLIFPLVGQGHTVASCYLSQGAGGWFWETAWHDQSLLVCTQQLAVANAAQHLSALVSGSPRPPWDQCEPCEPDSTGRWERRHHLQWLWLAAARRWLDGGWSPLHQHAPGRGCKTSVVSLPNVVRAKHLPGVPSICAGRTEGQVYGGDCYEKCERAVSKRNSRSYSIQVRTWQWPEGNKIFLLYGWEVEMR